MGQEHGNMGKISEQESAKPEQMDLAFEGDENTEVVHTRAEIIKSIREKMFHRGSELTEEEKKFMKDNPLLFDSKEDRTRYGN
ncbi:MAG: hypothetical protein WC884_00190 [Candidatus Paceibacterota bacterium]